MQIANFSQINVIVVIQKVTFVLLTSSENTIKVDNYGEFQSIFKKCFEFP